MKYYVGADIYGCFDEFMIALGGKRLFYRNRTTHRQRKCCLLRMLITESGYAACYWRCTRNCLSRKRRKDVEDKVVQRLTQ